MSNKRLIQQYAQVVPEINEYQFNRFPESIKKTYIRQTLMKFNQNEAIIPHFIYKTLSTDEKSNVVEKEMKDFESYGINKGGIKNNVKKDGGDEYVDILMNMMNHPHLFSPINLGGRKYPLK